MEKLTFGNNTWHITPKNWQKASNGGDYAFGKRAVFLGEKTIGYIQTTSSEFDFCEITGIFTPTKTINVIQENGETIITLKGSNHIDGSVITVEEFIEILKKPTENEKYESTRLRKR